jgi:hypothetical protein
VKVVARVILVILLTALLVAPVFICNSVKRVLSQIIVIILSNLLLQALLATLAKFSTIELIMTGAT